MPEPRSPRLAVLIDADNASAKIVDGLFEEIAKIGEASVRRIYGDFASTRSKAWIDVLAKHAIIPQQQFAYTTGKNASERCDGLEKPEDRREAARTYIETVGGKLHGFWYAFGEHDGWSLWEALDNVSMAAVSLAVGAGGAVSAFETTVLLSIEDTIEALGKAQSIRYRPPAR